MTRRDEALAVLVRAPAGLVYAVLTDVDAWDTWWPGCTSRRDPRADAAGVADHHLLRLPGGRRTLRCRATGDAGDHHLPRRPLGRRGRRGRAAVGGWRHDRGLRAELRGGADAEAEWWLEPVEGGVIVHLLVTARGRRADRTVRALGGGLQALKDHLELAVAVAAGRVP
ncbi:MAG: SRPBCC family protein [Nitriliruptoraceae bacterium]